MSIQAIIEAESAKAWLAKQPKPDYAALDAELLKAGYEPSIERQQRMWRKILHRDEQRVYGVDVNYVPYHTALRPVHIYGYQAWIGGGGFEIELDKFDTLPLNSPDIGALLSEIEKKVKSWIE